MWFLNILTEYFSAGSAIVVNYLFFRPNLFQNTVRNWGTVPQHLSKFQILYNIFFFIMWNWISMDIVLLYTYFFRLHQISLKFYSWINYNFSAFLYFHNYNITSSYIDLNLNSITSLYTSYIYFNLNCSAIIFLTARCWTELFQHCPRMWGRVSMILL